MTIGISGSGKSTYLKNNFDKEVIVCPDLIRKELCGDISDQSKNGQVWSEAKSRLLRILENSNVAVLDATNVIKFRRIQFMSDFNGCKKIAWVFPVDLETAIQRVQKDIKNNVDRSNVPVKVIKRQYKNFNHGIKSLVHEFNEIKVFGDEGMKARIIEKLNEERNKNV